MKHGLIILFGILMPVLYENSLYSYPSLTYEKGDSVA